MLKLNVIWFALFITTHVYSDKMTVPFQNDSAVSKWQYCFKTTVLFQNDSAASNR